MSEKNDSGMDLSRIVGLIMENPKLISEISELVRQSGEAQLTEKVKDEEVPTVEPIAPVATQPRERRAALLYALKPYVSEKRAQAIDSMITITEMIDLMKAR